MLYLVCFLVCPCCVVLCCALGSWGGGLLCYGVLWVVDAVLCCVLLCVCVCGYMCVCVCVCVCVRDYMGASQV